MDKHSIRSVWEKFLEVQEKKLDPVGKEDGDIDNDGDKDSSDEYLAKKRKAIGKAMKKEELETEDKSQFMYAAKMAKKKGDQEFVFAGKKYKTEHAYSMDEEDYPVPPKTKKPGDALEPVNNRTAKLKEDETDKPYPTPKKVKKAGDELEDVKNRTAKLKEDESDKPYPTPKKVKKAGDELEDVKNRTSKLKEWSGKEGNRRVSGGDKRKLKEEEVECPKCEGKGCSHCDDKGYHMKESVGLDTSLFSESELAALEEKAAGEEFMSTSSAGEKKFAKDHQKSDPKLANVGDHDNSDKAGKVTKQSAARNAADNLGNGDSKTAGKL